MGWTRLPKRSGEREHFAHSTDHAEESFTRLTRALEARARCGVALNASGAPSTRLFVRSGRPEGLAYDSDGAAEPEGLPDDPNGADAADEYLVTTNVQRAVSGGATPLGEAQFLLDRKEGRYLASAEVGGHWIGISKVLLTLILAQGRDAIITGVPPEIVEILHLTSPELVDEWGQILN